MIDKDQKGLDYLSKTEAERFCGKNLDGRFKYYIWDDVLCTTDRMTVSCDGCCEVDQYGTYQGVMGIHQCGYTGKRVVEFPAPVNLLEKENLTGNASAVR